MPAEVIGHECRNVVCVLTFRRGVIGEIAHYFRRSL
jgi:hypothetical protein